MATTRELISLAKDVEIKEYAKLSFNELQKRLRLPQVPYNHKFHHCKFKKIAIQIVFTNAITGETTLYPSIHNASKSTGRHPYSISKDIKVPLAQFFFLAMWKLSIISSISVKTKSNFS